MVDTQEELPVQDLEEVWPILSPEERVEGFRSLRRAEAEEFFESLSGRGRAQIIQGCPPAERRSWLRLLAPDDVADVLQEIEPEERGPILALVEEPTHREVLALLTYAEDAAGGLMNPRAAHVRPTMTVDEAISYLRRQVHQQLETIYYIYVLDSDQHLRGVVSLRQLVSSLGSKRVEEVMEKDVISVPEDMDQESVARIIAQNDFLAVPVVDSAGRFKGIVTVDDIVDVVQEEATEDIQKMGGMEALEAPYLQTNVFHMVRKRAGWLSILLVGEMFTTSAMTTFEDEIRRATVLSLFVPLILSSGGNSGSQASTLVIRAMALGQVRLRDWYRIVRRELLSGVLLGLILATIGLVRILLWQQVFHTYGEHYMLLAWTVAMSLLGIVLWGTICGAMLPFLLRAMRFDPASASAPFVATVVDVAGIVIYFSFSELMLRGTLL